MDGVGIVPVAMGLFGIAEVLSNLESKEVKDIFKTLIRSLLPNRKDWMESIGPIVRGSFIGFFLGILPGGGAIMASFTSYAIERRVSRHPESFGHGAIAGVAGPETANNAATGGAMIPLLSLGVPGNIITALLLGAMMIHGIKPSSIFINQYPQIFWGLVTSMYVGNALLLLLNLPMIGLWVRLLKVRYGILFPLILLICLVGVYSMNNNIYDILVMLVFGALGYLMRKVEFEVAPLLFAMIIGPLMETSLRQTLLQSRGNFIFFFTRPISATLIGIGLLLLFWQFLPMGKKRRGKIREIVK